MEIFYSMTDGLSYIGPGAGMGLLLSLIGLVTAIGAALFTILLWPIRKMMKRRQTTQPAKTES